MGEMSANVFHGGMSGVELSGVNACGKMYGREKFLRGEGEEVRKGNNFLRGNVWGFSGVGVRIAMQENKCVRVALKCSIASGATVFIF